MRSDWFDRAKPAYWRFKGNKNWMEGRILELGNGLARIKQDNYYGDWELLSVDDIEIKWAATPGQEGRKS